MKVILLSFYEIIAQKATWTLSTMITLLMSFFLPIETYIFCSFLAVFADFICGWAAAANRGEGFQGKKIRETFVKLLLYVTVTASFYHISRSLSFPFDITYFVVSMISVAEMMSILRNVGDYTGYDYEGKIREVFPKIADFLPKSKNIATIAFLLSSYFLSAQGGLIPIPIRVDLAPIQSSPTDANTEFYTQKGGTAVKRVPFGILQKSIAPLALPTMLLSYIPTATANPIQDRGRIVRGSNQNVYYIDWEGRAIQLGSSGAQSTYTAGSGLSLANNQFVNTGDLSNTNEIQSLTKTGNLIQLSLGGGSVFDSDGQTLSLSGQTLSLVNGGSVTLPTGSTYTAGTGISINTTGTITNAGDLSDTNEIQALSLAGQTLSLSNGGGSVTFPSGGGTYTAGSGVGISTANVITADDNSATNEAQSLSQSGQVVTLSNVGTVVGGSFTLPTVPTTIDASATDAYELPTTTSNAGKYLKVNTNADGYELGNAPGGVYSQGNSLYQYGTFGSVGNLPHPIAGANTTVSAANSANGIAVNVTGVDVSATDLIEIPLAPANLNGLHLVWDNHATPPAAKWEATVLGASAGTGINFGGPSGTTIAANDPSLTNEIQTLSAASGTNTGTNLATASRAFKNVTLSSVGVQTGTTSQGVPIITQTGGGVVEIEDRYNTSVSSAISSSGLSTTVQDSGGGSKTSTNGGFGTSAATSLLGFNGPNPVVNTVSSVLSANTTVSISLNNTNQLITKVNGVEGTPLTLPSSADNWGTQVVSHGQTLEGNGATTSLDLVNSGVAQGTYNSVTVNPKGIVTGASNVNYQTALAPNSLIYFDRDVVLAPGVPISATGVVSASLYNFPSESSSVLLSMSSTPLSGILLSIEWFDNALNAWTSVTASNGVSKTLYKIAGQTAYDVKFRVVTNPSTATGLNIDVYYYK